MKKKLNFIIGGILFLIGIVILFSSLPVFTGHAILEYFSVLWNRIIGTMFIVMGLVVMSVAEINAAIKSSKNLEGKVGYGKNVEIDTIFIRHGEKDKEGQLTETGAKHARAYGEKLTPKDVIKGYGSSFQRAIDTTENIIESAPHNKKLKTRIKEELTLPRFSKAFDKEYFKRKKVDENTATDWYLNMGDKRFDKESISPKEIAEGFAYMLNQNIKMSGKLYSGSKVDLIEGTHQVLPESLLKEVMIRYVRGEKVIGFDSIKEIGGALGYAEPVDFKIKRDKKGDYDVKLDFRGKEYEVDMNRLNQLANSYRKRVKGRK